MPRSTSTISTIPTVMMAMVTPGSILPGNDFVRATSVLHTETTAAILDINAPFGGVDAQLNASILAAPTIGGRAPIISMLKTLLDDGIIKPLLFFHARIVHNAQDRQIAKATVEPLLEQAAARIAAVVKAECPTNHPTLKGLIHDNVDKTTEELRRRVQSLEAKLGEVNATKGKGAKNKRGGNKKSKKMSGMAVAPSTVTTKSKSRSKATKMKKNPATKVLPASPADNDNASNAASKKSKKKATAHKSGGKGRGKSATAYS